MESRGNCPGGWAAANPEKDSEKMETQTRLSPREDRVSVFRSGTESERGATVLPSQTYEILTLAEIAERLRVRPNTIREFLRSRCPDPIPHLRMGRKPLFEWGSPWLEAWICRRRRNGLTGIEIDAGIGSANRNRGESEKRRRK